MPDYLKLAVASLDLGSDSEVLDVAAGTGLLFRAFSPRVGRVVALWTLPPRCRPKGKVLVADLVSPEEEELAARYNELESLRDGTHQGASSERVEAVGSGRRGEHHRLSFRGWRRGSRSLAGRLRDWPEEHRAIREAMDLELKGSIPTCFQPFTRDGKIMFGHTMGVVVGEKQ